MQDRLLDATIACLSERGYAATSTTEIVRRAGVSRGAQVHHFPTKTSLVVAAMDRLLQRRLEEFEAAFAAIPVADRTADLAIDVLWTMFQGETFEAWLELQLAARTDPELCEHLRRVDRHFEDGALATFIRTFPNLVDGLDSSTLLRVVQFAFTVLSGASLGTITRGDGAGGANAVETLKFLSHQILDPRRAEP